MTDPNQQTARGVLPKAVADALAKYVEAHVICLMTGDGYDAREKAEQALADAVLLFVEQQLDQLRTYLAGEKRSSEEGWRRWRESREEVEKLRALLDLVAAYAVKLKASKDEEESSVLASVGVELEALLQTPAQITGAIAEQLRAFGATAISLHHLKVAPEPFAALRARRKRHEFRIDDRTPRYEVGDVLVLHEWLTMDGERLNNGETGETETRVVTYISRGPDWGIPAGYCVMSLGDVK